MISLRHTTPANAQPTEHKIMKHRLVSFIAAVLAVLLLAGSALAGDRVHLKDGRVLEGTISREGDTFLYITYSMGTVDRTELVLKSDIVRVEREAEEAETPTPSSAPARPAPANAREVATPRPAAAEPSNARRIAFISLEEMVGPLMNAKALKRSIDLLEDDNPDIVVLVINSGGGALFEIEKLSDVIQNTIKPKYRVVVWVKSAISAAAMTAWAVEEIYMMPEGNIGAATGYSMSSGGAVAVKGEDLEQVFRLMQHISARGNRDPLVMRAMQVPTDLSADIDPATGKVTWRNDLEGQHIVSTTNQILTFNSVDAVRFGVARAVAASKDELARQLGADGWVEVGQDADEYQITFREDVQTAQVRVNELFQKMNIALQGGNVARARSFLGQMRGWVRRATSLEEYGAPDFGIPPLNSDYFREVEKQLDEINDRQRQRQRR